MKPITDLDAFLRQSTHEAAQRSAADERRIARNKSEAYAANLQQRARGVHAALEDERFDAVRFRFWFDHIDKRFTLAEWRRRIDEKISADSCSVPKEPL